MAAATDVEAHPAILQKIARLVSDPGAEFRVLDLFAGCGGISLGFAAAGFRIVAAAELDPLAARSHALNFLPGAAEDELEHHGKARDLTTTDPGELAADFDLGSEEEAVDLIVGGPPCQAYARVGRAKLREIAEHPEAFRIDPRANLYLRYLHYVERMRPLAILMENVPDILNHGGHNIVEEMAEALDPLGYDARYSLINSAHHGVPQTRDRVFMVAVHRALGAEIKFPRATHRCDLPPGYSGTRSVALRLVDRSGAGRYMAPDTGTADLPHAVTAAEAIGDLAPITLHRKGLLRRGARRFDELARYAEKNHETLSSYARLMRSWPGFENHEGVYDHVIRSLPRDTEIFEAMTPGDEYPAAHRVARRLFEAEARRRRIEPESAAWDALSRQMVPPYDPGKFPNRWWKLRADFPARTLMAHLGKDTYSHIHYDGAQARVISVREAARLQSFPDGFLFAGTMNPAYRQIGNAVPPIMAKEMAIAIRLSLEEALAARRAEPLQAAE